MKCCLNCRFYDMNAYHECREEIEEPVMYKDLANFCDLFVLNDGTDGSQAKSQEEARHKFLKLFNDEQ